MKSLISHTYFNRSLYFRNREREREIVRKDVLRRRETRSHASRIQHGACFIMAYALKPICCTLGGSRARYGTIKGKSFSVGYAAREKKREREWDLSRVRRMSGRAPVPDALSKARTRELLAAEEGTFLPPSLLPSHDFICRFIYEI